MKPSFHASFPSNFRPKFFPFFPHKSKFLYNQSIPSILAGGDIIGASHKFGFDFHYVSTGGGSTLEYLEGRKFKTLERLTGENNK